MRPNALRAVLLAVAVTLASLTAYHLGKDCGAWEAKRRLRGDHRPALCFASSGTNRPGR